MILSAIAICFKLLGALALFMFGMHLSSDGFQRAAGDRLQGALNFMTKNRLIAVVTGAVVTVLIQSSSATTVMAVTFANAGLLSLVQTIGVIMGANIGTTITGWIIAAVGIQTFSVSLLAVPLFGIGFFMSVAKRRGDAFVSYGQALMGFALIFFGLEYLSKAIPEPSPDALLFLHDFANRGWIAVVVCVLAGITFTMLIHASSATIAIVIGLVAKGVISFEMAAAITLGSNIGTTIDSFLISMNANVNGRRAAWAHICFNVFGTFLVLAVWRPFLLLVDFVTPGAITVASAGAHIAMFHTMFNIVNTIVLMPLVSQYARALTRLVKPRPGEDACGRLCYRAAPLLATPGLNVTTARHDIGELAGVSERMFERLRANLMGNEPHEEETLASFTQLREYAVSMQEGISKFLLKITRQDINDKTRENIGVMLRMAQDFESVAISCENMAIVQEKALRKKQTFAKEEIEQLEPFTALVCDFLAFVRTRLDHALSEEELAQATNFENQVDAIRADLKRMARKRIKAGNDVKTELTFIDLIRHIEKIGDHAYSIAIDLSELK